MDNVIRQVRTALGLSQAEFALKLGRSYQSVRAYEKSGCAPDEIMQKIRELASSNLLVAETAQIDGLPNAVLLLRKALKVSFATLARLTHIPPVHLASYEHGDTIPDEHRDILRSLAVKNDLADIAIRIGGDEPWTVDHIKTPSGHKIHPGGKMATYPQEYAEWIDLLVSILGDGDDETQRAVKSNLVVFGKHVRLQRDVNRAKKKSAG